MPPLIAGVPLAVGVLSYAGSLTLAVTAPDAVRPDPVLAGAGHALARLASRRSPDTT